MPPQGMVPPGPQRKSRRAPIIVAVVVVLVAAAGGLWFFTRGSGGDGPDTPAAKDYEAGVKEVGAAEVAWQVKQGTAPEAMGVTDYWMTETHLVRRLPGRLVSYDVKSGDVAWELALEGPPDDNCRASREHSNNRVAVLVATDAADKCGKLVVVDIATGKAVTTVDFPEKEGPQPTPATIPVVAGERIVLSNEVVLDLNTGAPAAQLGGKECELRGAGLFGELLITDSRCSVGKGRATNQVNRLRGYDAGLNLAWEWDTPEGDNGDPTPVLGVLSAEPLVLQLGSLGHETQLVRLDPASGTATPLSDYKDDLFLTACNGRGLTSCPLSVVVDNKVVLMTILKQINPDNPDAAPGQQATEFRNELVAFDLDTGKKAWGTGMVHGRALSLVDDAGGQLAAYQPENPNGTKGILFAVDPATGKLKPLLPIGPKAHDTDGLNKHVRTFSLGGDNHDAIWRDGLFIMFKTVHRVSTEGEADTVAFTLK